MKNTKAKSVILAVAALVALMLAVLGFLNVQPTKGSAVVSSIADEQDAEEFVVSSIAEHVPATYYFTILNEEECSVSIANKSEATKAVVPSTGEINGKEYTVTEVALNGFMSSSKLTRVSLPYTIKKIGNMAFANCAKLERVSLANVQEIGNSVFYRCPSLSNLVIPKSVVKIGSTILRGNSTQVRVRAELAGAEWASDWNTNNNIQAIEFHSQYAEPLELEPMYEPRTRSGEPELIGYEMADGQPRVDSFYGKGDLTDDNWEGNNIFIPNMYQGQPILALAKGAFEDVAFDKLFIEYYEKPIEIRAESFVGTYGEAIVINRSVTYNETANDNIFTFSEVETVVLPHDLPGLTAGMFSNCWNLQNIFFHQPEEMTHPQFEALLEELRKDHELGEVHLPEHENFKTIGLKAFESTNQIKKLHIYSNVVNMAGEVFRDWTEDQAVFVHGLREKPETWHVQWNGDFKNFIFCKYTITFEPNGGELPFGKDTKDVEFGEPVGELPEPVRVGYRFDGWYPEGEGEDEEKKNQYTAGTVYTEEADIILVASWKNNTYEVTLKNQGGIGGTDQVDATFDKDMPEGKTAPKSSKEGWRFDGYYSEPEGKGTKYYHADMSSAHIWDIDSPTALYANYVLIETKIIYNLAGGTIDKDANPSLISYFDEAVILKEPTQVTYIFLGWYTEEGEKIEILEHLEEESLTLTARWKRRIPNTIIALQPSQTSVTISGSTEAYLKLSASSTKPITITVSSDVRKLYIFAERYKAYEINIIIYSNGADFDLCLENFALYAPAQARQHQSQAAITHMAEDSANPKCGTLNLYTYGKVYIEGASGPQDNTGLAYNGYYAILCKRLSIHCADDLSIIGGSGTPDTKALGAAAIHAENGCTIAEGYEKNIYIMSGMGNAVFS